jgi:hypothetical protein
MIGILFSFGSDVIEIRVDGSNLYFRSSQFGSQFAPLDGLEFNKFGVIKEFPDLAGDEEWKAKAIDRFRAKIALLKNDDEKANYLIEDLKKFGYVPVAKQKQGFRMEKIK